MRRRFYRLRTARRARWGAPLRSRSIQLPREVATGARALRRSSRKATRTRPSESPWPGGCRSTNGLARRRTLGGDFLGKLGSDGKDKLKLETPADFDSVLARLRRRDPESMAAFILSLAQDGGPVGEQVRTFIVGTTTEFQQGA